MKRDATRNDACKRFKRSLRTIDGWLAAGMPHEKKDGGIRLNLDECESWLVSDGPGVRVHNDSAYTAARMEVLKAQRELIDADNAIRAGQYVKGEQVAHAGASALKTFTMTLWRLGWKLNEYTYRNAETVRKSIGNAIEDAQKELINELDKIPSAATAEAEPLTIIGTGEASVRSAALEGEEIPTREGKATSRAAHQRSVNRNVHPVRERSNRRGTARSGG